MTYFIVDAPYEKCFDIFFKNELGFPNFYRMNELLPVQEEYSNLTLVAPYQTKEPIVLEKISAKIDTMGVKCLQFGADLETAFAFDDEGKVLIHPQFRQALHHAVAEFLGAAPPPSN